MEAGVGAWKKKAKTDKVILVGYSGGAMIASQIAARHPNDVEKLITIAGVLDKDKWTEYHNDEPLSDSVNLNIKSLDSVRQTHYIGEKDKIVPPDLAKDVLGEDNSSVIIVKGATHNKGYDKVYKDIWEEH